MRILLFLIAICGLVQLASATEECDSCKWIVKLVDEWLDSPGGKTVKEIEDLLEKLCALLPEKEKAQCDNIVDTYIPFIVNFVETQTPDTMCGLMKMCPQTEDTCNLCVFISTIAEQLLADNETEAVIVKELEKACNLVPSEKSLCKLIFSTSIPEIIEKLEQEFPPKIVCDDLKYCNPQSRPKKLSR